MEITLTALTGKNVLEGGEGDNYLKGHGNRDEDTGQNQSFEFD